MLDLLVFVSCAVIIFSEVTTHYARTSATIALQGEFDRAKRLNDEMQEALASIKAAIVAVKGEES